MYKACAPSSGAPAPTQTTARLPWATLTLLTCGVLEAAVHEHGVSGGGPATSVLTSGGLPQLSAGPGAPPYLVQRMRPSSITTSASRAHHAPGPSYSVGKLRKSTEKQLHHQSAKCDWHGVFHLNRSFLRLVNAGSFTARASYCTVILVFWTEIGSFTRALRTRRWKNSMVDLSETCLKAFE